MLHIFCPDRNGVKNWNLRWRRKGSILIQKRKGLFSLQFQACFFSSSLIYMLWVKEKGPCSTPDIELADDTNCPSQLPES